MCFFLLLISNPDRIPFRVSSLNNANSTWRPCFISMNCFHLNAIKITSKQLTIFKNGCTVRSTFVLIAPNESWRNCITIMYIPVKFINIAGTDGPKFYFPSFNWKLSGRWLLLRKNVLTFSLSLWSFKKNKEGSFGKLTTLLSFDFEV